MTTYTEAEHQRTIEFRVAALLRYCAAARQCARWRPDDQEDHARAARRDEGKR